ncbi:MAG TPA: anthranilate phosphoribosyltransferase [Bryobacteraceae bacterium]|nr:anthranilate phosphoribosyltransferase [Bryobacteraceae bacterium]
MSQPTVHRPRGFLIVLGFGEVSRLPAPNYSMSLAPYLHRVVGLESLSPEDAHAAMSVVLSGAASTPQLTAFLVALRMKGETAGEILGFTRAMREFSTRVRPQIEGEALVDTCGMGGDGAGTFNISTIAAFVAAGAGVRVAKHGSRSVSSKCGSADVLEQLGVKLASDARVAARAIEEIGIGFLFAPAFQPAMRHAQAARMELRMRTVFNMLGPLTNPAGATAQVVGAASTVAAELMAQALAELGLERGFVVHGSDGLDEITLCGETLVYDICNGRVFRRVVRPEDFGLSPAAREHMLGGGPEENAAIAREVLDGARGPRRDVVLMNAAAAIVVAGTAGDLAEGAELAAESIDSGRARDRLQALATFSTAASS